MDLCGTEKRLWVGKDKYIVGDVLHSECVIRGRGTACYKVHRKSEPLTHLTHYVVKDSWVDVSRTEREENVLEFLRGMCGVPVLIDKCVVAIGPDGQADTTARFRAALCSTSDPVWKLHGKDSSVMQIENREHRHIVMSPVGRRLEYFTSLLNFAKSVEGVSLSTSINELLRLMLNTDITFALAQ